MEDAQQALADYYELSLFCENKSYWWSNDFELNSLFRHNLIPPIFHRNFRDNLVSTTKGEPCSNYKFIFGDKIIVNLKWNQNYVNEFKNSQWNHDINLYDNIVNLMYMNISVGRNHILYKMYALRLMIYCLCLFI